MILSIKEHTIPIKTKNLKSNTNHFPLQTLPQIQISFNEKQTALTLTAFNKCDILDYTINILKMLRQEIVKNLPHTERRWLGENLLGKFLNQSLSSSFEHFFLKKFIEADGFPPVKEV